MKVRHFEDFVAANARMGLDDEAYSVIGLCGEAGEVAEWYKKVKMRGTQSSLGEVDLLSELGDVLHYVTRIALNHGWDLKECMAANVEKLEKRNKQ